jgi:hypothetical protein
MGLVKSTQDNRWQGETRTGEVEELPGTYEALG